ncbi:hypothetical protein Tco_1473844 [Tanacetum coccineum]
MVASTQALIDAFAVGSPLFPLPPTSPAYDQASLVHRATMISESSAAAAARPPRGQYDFIDTVGVGHGLIRSPGHDAWTIARAADRAEDVGHVRALQASKHRMMTSIKEVNLRVSYQAQVRRRESVDFYTQLYDAQTDRMDIRLKIDVVRGQRTAYETKLHEVRQAYLSSEARNRALLARLETLETHMSRMEWQRQSVEDRAVRQMMRTQVLEAKDQIDYISEASSQLANKAAKRHMELQNPFKAIIERAIQRNSTMKLRMMPAKVQELKLVCLSQWLERWNQVSTLWKVTVDNLSGRFPISLLLGAALPGGMGMMNNLMIMRLPMHDLELLKKKGKRCCSYTHLSQELALKCPNFLADETEKVDNTSVDFLIILHANVMSARPNS